MVDPQRPVVLLRLLDASLEVADDLNDTIRIQKGQGMPYRQVNDYRYVTQPEPDVLMGRFFDYNEGILDRVVYEEALGQLFDYLWLRTPYTEDMRNLYIRITESESCGMQEKCLAITALGLSLWRHFTQRKWELLLTTAQESEGDMQVRALTGIAFVVMRHKARFESNKVLQEQLYLLTESDNVKDKLLIVFRQIIRTAGTERLSKKLRDDILPELMKAGRKMQDKMSTRPLHIDPDEDFNPDWNKLTGDSRIEKTIREFSDLQMSGADVYFANFSELKRLPFFQSVYRWFLPFDRRQSQIANLFDGDGKSILDAFIQNGALCNSDKYSFCLSIQHMPEQQQKMVKEGLSSELEQQMTEGSNRLLPMEEWTRSANQYVQDLYRFFMLYPGRPTGEDNLMAYSLLWPTSLWFEKDLLSAEEQLNIADFLFAEQHYEEALRVYNRLKTAYPSASMYQKIGYAYEKLGYEGAIVMDNYEKADLLQPDDIWTLKRIAALQMEYFMIEKALETYRHIDRLQPSDKRIQMHISTCLRDLEQYEAAREIAFKVYWEYSEYLPAIVQIGDISFEMGNYEQAEKYWDMAIDRLTHYETLVGIGMNLWIIGKRHKALDILRKALQRCKNDAERDDFYRFAHNFVPSMQRYGISAEDARLLIDLI